MESKEPTFTITIRACSFRKLNMVELTGKLVLMNRMGFKKFYTISEDVEEEIPK